MRSFLLLSLIVIVCGQNYELNIVHYNDFHARFVETSPNGGNCDPSVAPCIGGFARLVTMIKQAVQRDPESLVLNGGDSFSGSIWYNLMKGNITKEFMNMIHHDAHVLGNHEFDHGIEELVPYLRDLNDEMVTANIIADEEPTMQGLFKPSIVVEKKGRKIGIIGVILATTHELASTGKLKFTDEVEAVKTEADKLTQQGVDIIVVLSHCGIVLDQVLAREAGPHIDIIVGGHSHTLLYNGDPPANSSFTPYGPYPLVIENESGPVLIVQVAAFSQYLGEIKLVFNETGHLLDWSGDSYYVGNEIVQDPEVIDKINEYLPMIDALAKRKIGESKVFLSSDCRCGECPLGNFICDAFMHAVLDRAEGNNWQYAHFCAINRGAIRASIDMGDITYEQMLVAMPFENKIEAFDLKGEYILPMLEHSVANQPWPGARMLQFSGLRVKYDGSRPRFDRVLNVTIRCIECDVPRYEPLDPNKTYKIVAQNFLASGGDGFTMISENRGPIEVIGLDSDLLQRYLERELPVIRDLDGRVEINDPCRNEAP